MNQRLQRKRELSDQIDVLEAQLKQYKRRDDEYKRLTAELEPLWKELSSIFEAEGRERDPYYDAMR